MGEEEHPDREALADDSATVAAYPDPSTCTVGGSAVKSDTRGSGLPWPIVQAPSQVLGVKGLDGSSAPLRKIRKRPARSVISILPSGRNARLHG